MKESRKWLLSVAVAIGTLIACFLAIIVTWFLVTYCQIIFLILFAIVMIGMVSLVVRVSIFQ